MQIEIFHWQVQLRIDGMNWLSARAHSKSNVDDHKTKRTLDWDVWNCLKWGTSKLKQMCCWLFLFFHLTGTSMVLGLPFRCASHIALKTAYQTARRYILHKSCFRGYLRIYIIIYHHISSYIITYHPISYTYIYIYSCIYRAFNCMPWGTDVGVRTGGCIPGSFLRTWKMKFCHWEALRGSRLLGTHLGTVCLYRCTFVIALHVKVLGLGVNSSSSVFLPFFLTFIWFSPLSTALFSCF